MDYIYDHYYIDDENDFLIFSLRTWTHDICKNATYYYDNENNEKIFEINGRFHDWANHCDQNIGIEFPIESVIRNPLKLFRKISNVVNECII